MDGGGTRQCVPWFQVVLPLPTAYCQLPTADCLLQTGDCKLETANCNTLFTILAAMKEAVNPVHATREEAAPLLHVFNYIHPLSAATEEYLVTHLYPNQLKRGTILHEQGRVCGTINFIKSGALRGYIIEGKKETTTWISVENETAAAVFSFNMQQPSIENIQVIEDCELLGMSYADLHRCYDLHADFNIAARRMYEKYYADAEVRALIARLSKAEMKYEYFLKTYSHLSNRIPLKYIASFLGINMATLSRIRSLKKPAASI